ncbi:hypothetical protein QAD02_006618 [Eretmocerus hayati]|uniref:Uncharacterized protein n=1 Tax=Eretmocerus hayati TaxID=131215 RepID=A0ACC2N1R6_9HYME|nr:hypothetical protein QAD02_006618 [Eretmocerus hayati]
MGPLNLRNRLLQLSILALLGITLYTYYRSTDEQLQQYALVRTTPNRTTFYETVHTHTNANSSDVASTPLTRNQSNSDASTNLFIISLSNASNNPSPSGGNASAAITLISSAPSTPVINKDSAGAIYPSGHTVSVPEKCPDFGKFMDLMIIIMSAPNHFEARTAIRQTWAHYGQRRDIGLVFMLGSTNDARFESSLEKEQDIYGDIVRGRFIDSYLNLTLKTMSTLEWVDTYCSEVKFVLKTDDDMFINVPRLLAFIYKHKADTNVIFGKVAKRWKPVRSKTSKYYISPAQYRPPFYPDFCTGPAYLMSSDVVSKLYINSLQETFLKLEDVFMTGIVASKLGIKRSHASEFHNKKISYSPCNVQRAISIHMVKYSEQFDLWKKLLDGKTKCK